MSGAVARGAAGLLIAALAGGCTAIPEPQPPDAGGALLPQAVLAPLLAAVPEQSVTSAPVERLAEGLLPPTNRWFSGLVFGSEPNPVFPLPLSFALSPGGYRFGVPAVSAQPGSITAPFAPDVSVDTGATRQEVTAYDDVSVTITGSADGQALGSVTIARGSPLVSYRAHAAHSLRLSVPAIVDGSPTLSVGANRYVLLAPEGELSADGRNLFLPADASATVLAVPVDGDVASLLEFAESPVVEVTTEWTGDSRVSTALEYRTESGGHTLFGVLPHQRSGRDDARCRLGSYATVYGPMGLCSGAVLEWEATAVEPASALDLSGLDAEQVGELTTALERDIATTPELPTDTYFGGKALARLATLLQLARGLSERNLEVSVRERLLGELRMWTDADGCADRQVRCFVYDPALAGIVGLPSSFGSEEFNDHHFHYGHFLFAAGVAADGDPDLVDEFRPMMSLLAADIAGGDNSQFFPARRVYDAYSGHSWASGFAPFADGNNQESSSEAVAAWNGLAIWAEAAGDQALFSYATWMLGNEANAASAYWLGFDRTSPPYDAYDRSVVGIVWDGKRDWSTWFSAEPAAVLGIQLIPMTPVAEYLAGDPDRIRANIAEAWGEGPAQFEDYLLMYSALAGPEDAAEALPAARRLPAAAIDDGNSRAYLLAWIMTHSG